MNATLWPVFGGFPIFFLLASASLSSASEPYPVPGEASARFEVRLDGVAVPVAVYRIEWNVDWNASFGYNRTEDYIHYDNQGRAETRFRTIVDWRPANGSYEGSNQLPPIYAGQDENNLAIAAAESFSEWGSIEQEKRAVTYSARETPTLEGNLRLSERFQNERDKAIIRTLERTVARSADQTRGWHYQSAVQKEVELYKVPVISFERQFEGKIFNISCSGIEKIMVYYDSIPQNKGSSWRKHWPALPIVISFFTFGQFEKNSFMFIVLVSLFWFSVVAWFITFAREKEKMKKEIGRAHV
jgi:hypothetical protein